MSSIILERIIATNYKSFRTLDLPIKQVNVLIGANGAGKSNIQRLFGMIKSIVNQEFQAYIDKSNGSGAILHYGHMKSDLINITIWFKHDNNLSSAYHCKLVPAEKSMKLVNETIYVRDSSKFSDPIVYCEHDNITTESHLPHWANISDIPRQILDAIRSWHIYNFNDSSALARAKQPCNLDDNLCLAPDASNLPAYLDMLRNKYPKNYDSIVQTIRMVNPSFSDFFLRRHPFIFNHVELMWKENNTDFIFNANMLSDNMLRFIFLTTLFLQPREMLPSLIVLDNADLGLHPYAIVLLAEMIHSVTVTDRTKVVLSTQSATLIDQFEHEDILLVELDHGISMVRRIDQNKIVPWLAEYSLGELWQKNVLEALAI